MSLWLGGMVETNQDDMLRAHLKELRDMEEGKSSEFNVTLQGISTTRAADYETELKRIVDRQRALFEDTIGSRVDSVFARKEKEMLLKVNLSFLTDKSGNNEISEIPSREQQQQQQITLIDGPTDDSIKKKLSAVITDYHKSLSVFVGFTALVYAAGIPCATIGLFNSFVITAGVGIGLFGMLGILNIWDLVGDINSLIDLYKGNNEERVSVWKYIHYIGVPLFKLCGLIGFSIFFAILLSFMLHDKSCDEKGKSALPPLSWSDY